MKDNLFALFFRFPAKLTALSRRCRWLFPLVLAPGALTAGAAPLQVVHETSTSVVTKLTPTRHSSLWNRLNLSISLPLRDREGLTNLLCQLYDPASTNYHRFLTAGEFAQRFGPTEQDYATVLNFARRHGFTVTAQHPNRALVSVRGTVADIERAFHVTMNEYQHPTESRTFFAPDREPSIDLAVPVLAIGGLDNFVVPHPCLRPVGAVKPAATLTGSGPGGAYLGYDFRSAYVPGVPVTGAGQTVGLLEFDSGYYQSDITAYEALAGLPDVPVTPVLLDGYNGGPGIGNDEVSLDIEVAIAMAPGLKSILVYEGSTTDDILNRIATDNSAKQIGASWGYSIDAGSEQAFLQMAAQGQSFFNASGDSDAYPGAPMTPSDDPNITIVGGTTLTTTGPGGAWVSETVWNRDNGVGSSGGISTRYPIPSWQQGISMTANQGSTTMRNIPDVALTAENVYIIFDRGAGGAVGGTSCATPLWAAFMALANQLALTNGEPVVGFINPLVYAMGKGSNMLSYTALFHDITTGNNESPSSPNRFSAVPGYDLCTGWGTPTGSNLISALALPEPLRISPGGSVIVTGPVGGPFTPAMQTYTLTNGGGSSINWALGNTSVWFSVSPSSGTLIRGNPATTVNISLTPAATNLPAGSYSATLWFTNLADHFVQTRQAILDIVTPPVITLQPANEALLIGMTANFSVTPAVNSLLFFRWQENGTNLGDGGQITGSATSALTVSNVTANNIGAYSVILSNAAGVLASSNALLTIVPSAPVIVVQPTNQSVLPGAPAYFSVAAVGNTPYSYRWQFNGGNLTNGPFISGALTSSLVVSNVLNASAGVYSVIVSNSLGFTTSTGAVLSVVSVTPPGIVMSTLWSFTNGISGAIPYSPLTQGKDGNFYGTTLEGGADGFGLVFRFTTNGIESSLLAFNLTDGAFIYAGLTLASNGLFYGAAESGGTYDDGDIFKIAPTGGFGVSSTFNSVNGLGPVSGMIQGTDGNFYGTTLEGGDYGYGTVYQMTASGSLTTLVSFNSADGGDPSSVLVQGADGNFYGTTEVGGLYGAGTVFKMSPSGTLSTLYSFTGGNDGAVPIPGLVQANDGNFYGVTYEGGASGSGAVFRLTSSGVFSNLYSFTGTNDGANPWGGLMQASDGNLYGTTQAGGDYGFGTVFQIAPNGALTTIVQFDGYSGANPSAALIQATDGNLYGTAENGGSANDGALFKVSINGSLQITGQPVDQAAYTGGTAIFTVATSGGGPVSYQWQQDGVNLVDGGNISGSATGMLTITNVSLADAAYYSVIVSNAYNSVASDGAYLEIIFSPPAITRQPASQTCVAGTTVNLSVAATGDQPLYYQWFENGTRLADGGNISGSGASTLTIANVSTANAGSYSVIVSNALFAIPSAPAVLTVVPAVSPSAAMTELHLFSVGYDGAFPYGGLIQGKDNFLYGTAEGGATHYAGSVYRVTTAGGFAALYAFPGGADGANPYARLVQGTNGVFYGTTVAGGADGYGTIFAMTTGYLISYPYQFTGGSDGGEPENGLIQGSDGNFYGASVNAGADSAGTIFRVNSKGAFTNVYEFSGETDGAFPFCDIIQGKDGKLYGTTVEGGQNGFGTVFSLTTNGTLATLFSFDYTHGAYPEAGVIQGVDGNLYGTTYEGGTNGGGTVFCLTTNGTLTTLFSFGNTNGSYPAASLLQASDGNLYGTCSAGGLGGQGTAFRITTAGALNTLIWFDGLNGAEPISALIQATDGNLYGTTALGGTGFNPTAGGGNGTVYKLTVPLFTNRTFAVTRAVACLSYSGTVAGKAVAPAGDTLSYSKFSGPAWLNVAANGVLSGTPTNSDIGTNIFTVTLTDTNSLSASAAMSLVVIADPPPAFVSNPFTEPWANVGEPYAGSIATNGTAPYLGAGDILTFAKVGGPAWLNVAGDGALSGTPYGPDAGTNAFIVSVAGLGGSSNVATLVIYVNSAPMFMPQDFVKPAAVAGIPYSGTIATNAVDPDIVAGDTLAFYKVTGPLWLDVATNGVLSGMPATADEGTDSCLVLVVDSGGLAGVGSMIITVNADQPPLFSSNPFSAPPVFAGQTYSATIATNAMAFVSGNPLTFSKVSGPAWLTVAPDGSLSGRPLSTNAGANSFVVSVSDFGGLSSSASLSINVIAIPVIMTVANQGGSLSLGWSGGVPPYQLQSCTNPAAGWQNIGGSTTASNIVIPVANAAVFYRIQAQ